MVSVVGVSLAIIGGGCASCNGIGPIGATGGPPAWLGGGASPGIGGGGVAFTGGGCFVGYGAPAGDGNLHVAANSSANSVATSGGVAFAPYVATRGGGPCSPLFGVGVVLGA